MVTWYIKNRPLIRAGVLIYTIASLAGGCSKKTENRKRSDLAATSVSTSDVTDLNNAPEDNEAPDTESDIAPDDAALNSQVAADPSGANQAASPASNNSQGSASTPQTQAPNPNNNSKPPTDAGKAGAEITFSVATTTKLCQDLSDNKFRTLGKNIIENKDTPLNDYADKPEFAMLNLTELELFKSVLVLIKPNQVNEFNHVLCDDFNGAGKVFPLDVLINKINDK